MNKLASEWNWLYKNETELCSKDIKLISWNRSRNRGNCICFSSAWGIVLPFWKRKSVQSLKLSGYQAVPAFHWSCSYSHFGSDMSLQLYNYEQIWVQGWENWVCLPLWDLCADCFPSTSQCSLSLSFLYWLLLQPIRFLKKQEIHFAASPSQEIWAFDTAYSEMCVCHECLLLLIPLSFYGCFSGKHQL